MKERTEQEVGTAIVMMLEEARKRLPEAHVLVTIVARDDRGGWISASGMRGSIGALEKAATEHFARQRHADRR